MNTTKISLPQAASLLYSAQKCRIILKKIIKNGGTVKDVFELLPQLPVEDKIHVLACSEFMDRLLKWKTAPHLDSKMSYLIADITGYKKTEIDNFVVKHNTHIKPKRSAK